MKKKIQNIILHILSIIFLIPYLPAYYISQLFKIEGYENMPSISEWISIE